jgi:ribose transport system substrate-binding protein
MLAVMAGCGDDSDDSTATSAASAPAAEATTEAAPATSASSEPAPEETTAAEEPSSEAETVAEEPTTEAAGGFDPAPFQAIVDSSGAEPTAFPELPAGPPAATGKSIVHINCPMAAEGCKAVDDGVVAAAKALGWKELTIDTGGDPKKVISAFDQAINTKADGIIVNSLPPAQIDGPVAKARAAGIPVVCVGCGALKDNAAPTETGVNHDVTSLTEAQGSVAAAQAVLDTEGQAKVLILSLPDFVSVYEREQAAAAVFEQCQDCEVAKTIKMTVADLATTLPTQIKSALQADPDINVIYVGFDAGAQVANVAIQQLGRDDVFTYSGDGLRANVAEVAKGGIQKVDANQPLAWMAWAGVDNLNRIFGGQAPLVDDMVPVVLLTEANAAGWMDGKVPVDYEGGYKALWGIG